MDSGTDKSFAVILLLEDDEMVKGLALQVLHKLGYEVTECSDGTQGMAFLDSEQSVDLLLTGVALLGKPFREAELARRLRELLDG